MKRIYNIILILAALAVFTSCSIDEIDSINSKESVKFVVRPTNFMSYDVSEVSTRALTNTELTELEEKIVNAYFLVFDYKTGTKISFKELTVTKNNIPSQELDFSFETEDKPVTACFIANVPSTYLAGINNYEDLNKIVLSVDSYASYDDTGYMGIPQFKFGETVESCFPMYGEAVNCSLSDNKGKEVTISLKRLFAKVNIEIEWDIQINTGNLFANQGFKLNFYKISNLPNAVSLTEKKDEEGNNLESNWVKDYSYFEEPIQINYSDETSVLTSLNFTIYVPEYILQPVLQDGINYTQTDKPNLFDPDTFPIFLTLDGIVQSTNFVDVPVVYNIYLGEDAINSFSLKRNNQYNNTITITGTGDAILGTDHRVEAKYHNLADPENTGTDNPANCYIIDRPGRYLIPTYMGNNLSTILGGIDESKTAVHSDGKNSIANIQFIEGTEDDSRNWIMFDVNMDIENGAIADLPNISDGNTVLEFKDESGKTVWSWHLWFVSGGYLGSNNKWLGAMGDDDTYPTSKAVMMPRNLGSSGAGNSDGVYYQWGDKDPYFTTSGDGGSSAYYGGVDSNGSGGGASKSVTDPCPPGYRVPSSSVWLSEDAWKETDAGKSNSIHTSLFVYYGNISLEESSLIIYPYSSYVQNGSINNKESNYIPFKEGKTYEFTSSSIDNVNTVSVKVLGKTYQIPALCEDIYKITEMEILVNQKEGNVWGSDGAMHYSYESLDLSDITISNAEEKLKNLLNVKTFTHTRKVVTKYGISLSNASSVINALLSGNLSEAFLRSIATDWKDIPQNTTTFPDADKGELCIKVASQELSNISITNYKIETQINTSNGYQVRCVKE